MSLKRRKRHQIPAAERERAPYLERDFDGYVHTPGGFLSKAAYIGLVRENPDAGLPEWDALPVMSSITY